MCSDVLTRAKSVALNVTDPSLLSGMFIDTRRWANSSVSCTLRSFAVHMSSPQQRLLHLLVSKSDCLFCYWHYPHSTGAGSMYLCTVSARLSVCPFVRLSHSPGALRCSGLLLWARKAEDIDRLLPGAQQQPRRSTARCSKCGQRHVVS